MSQASNLAQSARIGNPNTKKPKKPKKKLQNVGSCTGMTKIDYCTEYASIKCTQSSHFLKLQVLPMMNRPKFGPFNHLGATITDCIPEINYPVFTAPWNLCFSLLNPQVLAATTAKFAATGTWSTVPMPCCLAHLPIGIWGKSVGEMKLKYIPHTGGLERFLSFRNLALFFRSNPETDCLTKNCTLTCAWMGTITIASSGRDEANPIPYNPVDGLIGPSVFDCLRNACGMIMNYTGLAGTAALAALDSVFAGLQKGFETGDAMEGLFAGLKTAAGYAIGFGIAGAAGKGGGAFLTKTKIGKNLASKVSVKFSAFAQSGFVRGLNKLHVKEHKIYISLGQSLKKNTSNDKYSTYVQGAFLEWLGRRNLEKILRGRNEILTKANSISINRRNELDAKTIENLEDIRLDRALKDALARANEADKKAADALARRMSENVNDRAAKSKALDSQYAKLKDAQDDDLARRLNVEESMSHNSQKRDSLVTERDQAIRDRDDLIKDRGELQDIRRNMNDENAPEGFPEYVDKKIAEDTESIAAKNQEIDDINRKIDSADRENVALKDRRDELDSKIQDRNEEMSIVSREREDINNRMDDDSLKLANNRQERNNTLDDIGSRNKRSEELSDDIARKNNENERLAQEWVDNYQKNNKNEKLNSEEIASNNSLYDDFGLVKPNERQEKGWEKAINDGNTANAKGAVNWTTDNIANTTYQGEIDSIGNGEPEAVSYDYSDLNGDALMCDDNPSGLHQD